MTGEAGLFDSRVLFVSESGTELNRLSRLAISDQDGFNPVYLTQGDEIIMSPRFSLNDPNEITYVALGKDYSRIYLFNLSTGRRESGGVSASPRSARSVGISWRSPWKGRRSVATSMPSTTAAHASAIGSIKVGRSGSREDRTRSRSGSAWP